ncbi:MAG: Oxyanion-translocating ATPase [Acidimicrobiaceae bacterium]|nr:Oxyanion-translocating ATPase [Acidimicrobiaceae bacterium]
MSGLLQRRLLFVSGKGGVGKTTVAAALGLLAASRGKRALVCETDPRGGLSNAYDCGPTAFQPLEVSPRLFAMSMDTEASLREYLKLNLRVPMVGRIGPLARAFDFVATAAPGVREVLTVGKLCWEVREGHFDIVVVDASASGHIIGQLAAPIGINELVRVGAIRNQTDWMLEILDDPAQTGVCLVATPEETPVNEAVELVGRLKEETGVHLAAVIANRVLPELFSGGDQATFDALCSTGGIRRLSEAIGRGEHPILTEVLEAARLAVQVRRSGAEHLARLREGVPADVPLIHLPYLFGRSNGPRAIRQVADFLGEELGE